MEDIKMTRHVLRLLSVLVNNPKRDYYGLEFAETVGASYGNILPVLMRLEKAGWLETNWENIDPAEAGRPKRKYYRLSREGMAKAREQVDAEVVFLQQGVKLV
jgi:PadR family transcriptional regulator PadR